MAPSHSSRTVGSLAELADARSWVGRVLGGFGVRCDDAALVTTELLSNAIRHARSSAELLVTVNDRQVRIAVRDRSAHAPSITSRPGPDGGYGLRLIETVSTRWGWEPDRDGKTVWCELPCAGST